MLWKIEEGREKPDIAQPTCELPLPWERSKGEESRMDGDKRKFTIVLSVAADDA